MNRPMTNEHYKRLLVLLELEESWFERDEITAVLRDNHLIRMGAQYDEYALTSAGKLVAEAWQAFLRDVMPGGNFELARKLVAAEEEAKHLRKRLQEAQAVYDGPLVEDWAEAVKKEAAHQVVRWGVEHDDGKDPEAWFWLLGRLAGKAVDAARRGDLHKALHHTISSGAVLLNWHARLSAKGSLFRPGTSED